MSLPEFFTRDSNGDIRLTGHRIELVHLVHYYNEGHSPEMLVCQYPTLSLALVHKVIAFYLENRPEVDKYVADSKKLLAEQRDSSSRRLDAPMLRQRLEAQRQAEGA